MFHLTVLASGSSGNCSLIETESTRLLVDAGLSARKIGQRLADIGVAPEQIDGILVTHEHSDHVSGISVWSRRYGTPVYANRLTTEALSRTNEGVHWRMFVTGSEFALGELRVQSFPISHDAAEPVGFVLSRENVGVGFLTDLGFATRLVLERVRPVHTLVIETNHDEKLLQDDPKRPWSVKQRIFSRHGHLSNAAAAEVLAGMVSGNLRRAVLGHLSGDCNTPELALSTVRNRLAQSGGEAIEVICATQNEATPRMLVG
ncbi:MAG: MBL fold metallo-hydrolase [Verrucomicrobiota bacterium]